jgi:hypothetical protein
MIYVKSIADIPTSGHWAIIEQTSVTIPGDERSRTNPGHGYPESTSTYFNYIAFTNETEFVSELTKRLSKPYLENTVKGMYVSATYRANVVVTASKEAGATQ